MRWWCITLASILRRYVTIAGFGSALFAVLALLAPLARAKPFEFPADTFSFSNALYFDYQVKPGGGLTIRKRANGKVPDYSRHCFILVRAVLQFYKYAEFRPHLPRISDEEYRQRILQLSCLECWTKRKDSVSWLR